MKKILVTGANGMLGKDLCPILEDSGYEVIETDIDMLDITDIVSVRANIEKYNPDMVIHCAAYTNVDGAESDKECASKINVLGTKNVAEICSDVSIPIVYISTDYVFDGEKHTPYKSNDNTNPINVYGQTKLEGEKIIKNCCDKHYIIRTSWLYGIHGKNFVETMLNLAEKNTEIKVVDDQIGCPTWTVALANAIVNIIENYEYGTYQACGTGSVSWYGFAKKIFELSNVAANILPCSTEEFSRPAKRPKYSVMDNKTLCPKWEVSLKEYLALRF